MRTKSHTAGQSRNQVTHLGELAPVPLLECREDVAPLAQGHGVPVARDELLVLVRGKCLASGVRNVGWQIVVRAVRFKVTQMGVALLRVPGVLPFVLESVMRARLSALARLMPRTTSADSMVKRSARGGQT